MAAAIWEILVQDGISIQNIGGLGGERGDFAHQVVPVSSDGGEI